MKFIKNIIKRIVFEEKPKPLGRWNIIYSDKIMNQKIDLSNEDHCGPCGQYIITKIPKISKSTLTDINIKNLDNTGKTNSF